MPCDNKQVQTTRRKDKEGDVITTHTSKRVCANDVEDIKEVHPHNAENTRELERPQGEISEHLEEWEELVYPEALNQKPKTCLVVVRNKHTGEKTTKRVPTWAVDEIPSEQMLKQKLQPDNELKEAFSRFL